MERSKEIDERAHHSFIALVTCSLKAPFIGLIMNSGARFENCENHCEKIENPILTKIRKNTSFKTRISAESSELILIHYSFDKS